MGVAAVARTVSLILTVLLVPLCVACGQEATSSVPAAPPSGARLLWQGTIAAEDPLAIPDEPATTTGDGFWVSCSVSGDTGEGRNATIAFVPVPAETVNAGPKLSSYRRSKTEHPQPRSSPPSTSLPLPLSR